MLNTDAQLPEDIRTNLPGRNAVMTQAIVVDSSRWNRVLAERGLAPATGKLADSGRITLTRKDVFNCGEQQVTADNAFQLLYCSLAWGLGLTGSRLHQRLDQIAEHQDLAGRLLVSAWESVRAGAPVSEAYGVLTTNKGAGQIPWFGPAFSTKFLYFAQGSAIEPRHLILDEVVARNLRDDVWPSSPGGAWWPETYQRYCDLLTRWAASASAESQVGRKVAADEIEYALFKRQVPSAK